MKLPKLRTVLSPIRTKGKRSAGRTKGSGLQRGSVTRPWHRQAAAAAAGRRAAAEGRDGPRDAPVKGR